MTFVDVYVLIDNPEKKVIELFLNHYLDGFELTEKSFEFQQFSDNPVFVTTDVFEMMEFLIEKKSEYTFYWNNPSDGDIVNGMVFLNNDSTVTLGLSVSPQRESYYVEALKEKFMSSSVLICHEQMPPLNGREFADLANA